MPGPAEIAAAVRAGRLLARDVLEERRALAASHAQLNVFTAEDWDAAARAASDVDRRRAAGEPLGALAGVPITVKDVIAVAGWPLTAGSRAFRDHRATTTAPAVARLLAADAVLLGKTNCPEFAFGSTCANDLFGETRHPVFADRSPGGSSGGEAAAVAAGISSLGVGTDFGGSLRWPAACTGVTALRPTVGRVDGAGQVPGRGGAMAAGAPAEVNPASLQGTSQVIGPLAARVADLAVALSVMQTGRAPTRPRAELLRIGWSGGRQFGPVRPEIVDAVESAAKGLAAIHEVVDAGDVFADCLPAYNRLRAVDPMLDHLAAVRGREESVARFCRDTFAASTTAGPEEPARAWDDARAARSRALARFADLDVILLPVAGGPACDRDGFVDVDGERVGGWELMAHNRAVTLTGAPVVSVPVARSVEGLPISVQVIAAPWHDELALRVAGELEAAATAGC